MTTIAYRDGVLVSDSRVTSKGYIETDKCKKIWRLSDGALWGGAGHAYNGAMMLKDLHESIHKFNTGDEKSKWLVSARKYKGVVALLITPHGNVFYYDNGWEQLKPKQYPFYSIGSGSTLALGAMFAGASAVEAVKIAIAHDIYSGGRIQKLEL